MRTTLTMWDPAIVAAAALGAVLKAEQKRAAAKAQEEVAPGTAPASGRSSQPSSPSRSAWADIPWRSTTSACTGR